MAGQPVGLGRITRAALQPRPVWTSHRGYIISSVVGVVGLGAIWRFPYLVGAHGGGAFVIAYLVSMAVVALPLAIIESGAGRASEMSAVGLFRRLLGAGGQWFGWLIMTVAVLLMSYYYVVTGWTLGYFVDAVQGDVQVFSTFTGGYASLWWFFAVGVGAYLVLLRGVGALEVASRFLLPVLAALLLGLAVYAQTTAGAREAAEFYLTIDTGKLGEGSTWRAAAGQAFYQSGVGQGFLIAYASFSPAGMNLARSTLILAVANVSVALIAMAVVFPIVFTFDLAPDAGTQLAFTAFPRILHDIEGGAVIGVVFFGLLLVAAFTSCLGGTAVPIAAVREELHLGRRAAAVLVVAIIVAFGIPSALSHTPAAWTIAGEPVLDRVDQLTGSALVVGVGLASAAGLAWLLPRARLVRAIRARRVRIGPVRLGGLTIIWIARIVSPVAFILLVVSSGF